MPRETPEQLKAKWYEMCRETQIDNLIYLVKKLWNCHEPQRFCQLLETYLKPKEDAFFIEDVDLFIKLKEMLR